MTIFKEFFFLSPTFSGNYSTHVMISATLLLPMLLLATLALLSTYSPGAKRRRNML